MKMNAKRIAAMAAAIVLCGAPVAGSFVDTGVNTGIAIEAAAAGSATLTVMLQDSNYAQLKQAGMTVQLKDKLGIILATATTDENGLAVFKNVAEGGPYTIYCPAQGDFGANSVTCSMTANVNMLAQLPLPSLQMSQTYLKVHLTEYTNSSVNLSLAGVTISVYDKNGNLAMQDVTNSAGEVTFNDIADGVYTVKLTDAPAGYDVTTTNEKTITISGVSFSLGMPIRTSGYVEKLYVCSSQGTDKPDGDASFIGAQYQIFKDGALYTTFTVKDADGYLGDITLKDKEYAANWTIKMSAAPTGYMFLPIEDTLDMSKFPTYQTFTNRLALTPIAGKFKIGANPGDSFKIYLTSAGSYEAAATTEKTTVTFPADTSVVLMDGVLPYGQYTIENTKTNETTTAIISDTGIVEVNLADDGDIMYDMTLTLRMEAFTQADGGDSDPSKLVYGVFKDGFQVASYTYQELTSGNCDYRILGRDRNAKWTVKQIDTDSGFFSDEVDLSTREGFTDGANMVGYTFTVPRPILIKGYINITATPGDTIQYYLASAGDAKTLEDKGDVSTFGTFTMGPTGEKRVTVPYGTYVVKDLTTGEKAPLNPVVNAQNLLYRTTLPENPNPVSVDPAETGTSYQYTLKNIFGDVVAQGEYTPGMDIPKPDKGSGVYSLDIEITETDESGNKTTSTTNYPAVTISDDGMEVLNNTTFGDVDGDGNVSVTDVISMQHFLHGRKTGNSSGNWRNSDLNNDGKVNIMDFCLLKKMLLKQRK